MSQPGHRSAWYWLAIGLLKPAAAVLTRRELTGAEHVPPGGVVLAVNHLSYADPIALADAVVFGLGRTPRFLAKSSMFRRRTFIGAVMRGADQIPVERESAGASQSLGAAVAALHAGETIIIYPEGTVTRDPQIWPMVARTGVARLALLSGAPVVPIAQWGAQRLHDSYRTGAVRLWPPATVRLRVGPPVDLSRWRSAPLTAPVLKEATGAVMDAITTELEVLRGESAPAERYDPRAGTRAARGSSDELEDTA